MSTVREGFGKPKEGNGLEILKVGKDETKQFRIFPPKGKLAAEGKYALYQQQHYGYGVPDPKDPSKKRLRPFLCVEEKDGDKVLVSCPECRKIEEKTRMRDDQRAAEVARLVGMGVEKSVADKQAAKLVEATSEWLKEHNLDRKWYLVAMGEDGRIGFLIIPHKAKKAMDSEKKRLLAEEKIDVLDIDNGAWVEITRTGDGRSTEYTARIASEQIVTTTGTRAKVTKVSGFTDDQLAQALALPDLDSSSLIKRLSREQVKMLADSSGAPEEVEAIMNLGQKNDTKRREESAPRAEASPAPVRAAPVVQPTPAPVPKADPQAEMIAALQAQLAALTSGAKPSQAAAKPTPGPIVEDVKNMSDEDFLAKFGAK